MMAPYRSGPALAACTVIAKNYLPLARVLADSWRGHHPEAPFFVLLLDTPEGYFDPSQEAFEIVSIEQLGVPDLPGFLFKYSVLEASTAVKPYFMEYLFESCAMDKLLYLDPDILILRPLAAVSELLDRHSMVLIPHITSPYPDAARPNDRDILQAGTYNLGFLGLRNGPTARELFAWWQKKLYHECVVNFSNNLFVDQRWMDLAPALFDGVAILREPGYDVAYWNLHERQITLKADEVFANGLPCYFFHFSGFNPELPADVSKHQDRFAMAEIGEARELFSRYRELLYSRGWPETKDWPYTYGFFSNGVPIPAIARRYYRSLGATVEQLGNPFTWLELAPGINVVGYLTSEKGVGEGVRSDLRILEAAGIPHAANNFVDSGSENRELLPASLSTDNPYSVNLIHINADMLPRFARQNRRYLAARYNIGYWAWELSEFPAEWNHAFSYLDEVWTPSVFTSDSVARVSPIPVHTMPHAIDPEIQTLPEFDRTSFRLPADAFVFLFMFDFQSYLERKNPLGLIKAFRQAFPGRKDVLLLLKCSHAAEHPKQLKELQAAGGANVRILNTVLPRGAVHSLMSAADGYVSLHRSEGFGLTLAEAMLCGKPVIATAYSGNVDFMTKENSFPVPYKLIAIDRNYGPYKAGGSWADPDRDCAVDMMRYVVENRAAAMTTGAKGRTHVLTHLTPVVVGAQVRARLADLGLLASPQSAASVG
jgi:glycosyltransferase involved in cell wall biosynthesis